MMIFRGPLWSPLVRYVLLSESLNTYREQRVAILGAGGAGIGIASLLMRAMVEDGLPEDDARKRFYLVDRDGLIVDGMQGI